MKFSDIVNGVVTVVRPNLKRSEASRHAKRAAAADSRFSFSHLVFALTIVFLFLPLLVLLIYSFNGSKGTHWTGFSFVWYEELFLNSSSLWHAFWNTIIIALTSSATSTVVGTAGALGIAWYRFKLRKYFQTAAFLPMVMPEIIVGVSLAIFFAGIHLKLGLLTIYIAHTTFTLPFVFMMVMARLDEFDRTVVEAAHDLGASERQAMFRVVLPMCMPGIVSGFITAITVSLEDFVITYFVSGPGSSTLPLYIYSAIRFGVSPVINALSVVIIAATVLLTCLLRNFLKYIAAK
jgi:spermidine/putrescine transport system permease protein